jgi:hypothetical protein
MKNDSGSRIEQGTSPQPALGLPASIVGESAMHCRIAAHYPYREIPAGVATAIKANIAASLQAYGFTDVTACYSFEVNVPLRVGPTEPDPEARDSAMRRGR